MTVLGTGKVVVGDGIGTVLGGCGTSVDGAGTEVGAPRLVVAAGVGADVSLEQAVSSQLLASRVPAVRAAAMRGAFIERSFPAARPSPNGLSRLPSVEICHLAIDR
ncbi:hypothetical protein O3I_016015 [Nocardia brasiliensis ATCC 700358]|uniref:Uncharacterized protein n=1 Tax=Nocardia brasiliensis (strain ATCC 700358 / HUJEG-1) TaxID=1133849 RepID=K0EVQ6_NOCB7|nr:hypothetical protein O3I_016015 [Nocardia brasiliensis ATCC 700358]